MLTTGAVNPLNYNKNVFLPIKMEYQVLGISNLMRIPKNVYHAYEKDNFLQFLSFCTMGNHFYAKLCSFFSSLCCELA